MSVARIAARQFGVVSIGELRECGLSDDAVQSRVRNGRLHPLYRRVYAVGHDNPSLLGRFIAGVKAAGDGAVLSHAAGAALLGLANWDADRAIEVTTPGAGRGRHPGLFVHRTRTLEAADVRLVHGIRVTAPARTIVDLAGRLGSRPLRRLVREGQSLDLVTYRELVATLARLRPRRGARRLAAVLADGPAPTRSELEDIVLDLVLRGGFERPDVNVPLRIGGRRVIPDLRWARERLVVEADGAKWHDNPTAREDDAERQALLEAAGERVLRVTWRQAVSHGAQTLARIRAAGAPPEHRVVSCSG